MNLYDLHPNPEKAPYYDRRFEIPSIALDEAKKRLCLSMECSTLYDASSIVAEKPLYSSDPSIQRLEDTIAKNVKCSFDYAEFTRKRFYKGERIISTDPKYSMHYAYYIIKGRFPQGERAIAESAEWAFHYATTVMKGGFPLGERTIFCDPTLSVEYRQFLLQRRYDYESL